MRESVLERLGCATCPGRLSWQSYRDHARGEIADGVAWCRDCRQWYPIEDSVLELLPPQIGYAADRRRFWAAHQADLVSRRLKEPQGVSDDAEFDAQRKQQEHFDWYAGNDTQTYTSYEGMPFWRAVDAATFDEWRPQIRPGSWLLDVGCAQGRSSFPFLDLPIHHVGFDISKALVRQAIARYRSGKYAAEATFFVGDGARPPFQDQTFDNVVIYGVLHHLPDPGKTCKDVARVLRPGGTYFGSENNQTIFRPAFDLLMMMSPIWHEEAGAQPLISAQQVREWFAGTPVQVETRTSVFVMPHMVNLLGGWLFHATEWVGQRIPILWNNGGLVLIRGKRAAAVEAPRRAAA
jgi:SAM-dependent methyltransferase/uncharacterized protein YbaR (Trm112 family)